MAYLNQACWTGDNLYTPGYEAVYYFQPRENVKYVPYHHWIGLILAVQALGCVMPLCLWNAFLNISGSIIGYIDETSLEAKNTSNALEKSNIIRYMANNVIYFVNQSILYKTCTVLAPFLIKKISFIVCAIGQLIFITRFLDVENNWHGLSGVEDAAHWNTTKRFPRLVFCVVHQFSQNSDISSTEMMCVLPMNVFIDNVYRFLWFWFVLLLVYSSLDCFAWCIRLSFRLYSRSYITQQLLTYDGQLASKFKHTVDTETINKFTSHYLGRNGMLLVWLSSSFSVKVAAELISRTWQTYQAADSAWVPIDKRDGSNDSGDCGQHTCMYPGSRDGVKVAKRKPDCTKGLLSNDNETCAL